MYDKSGIYQLKYGGCQKRYVGQTGRNFQVRYKEHIQAIKSNNSTSRYAQHILESQHAYGPITDTMEILHLNKKGQLMNTWERFHIHRLSRDGLQLNGTHNPIFTLINSYSQETNVDHPSHDNNPPPHPFLTFQSIVPISLPPPPSLRLRAM
jgi:hypothetical protein